MARKEHDREDLLREAIALIERAELQLENFPEPIVAGFRRDGSFAIYFGGDPVYQFNSVGELRRAFIGGLLYKAEQGRLVALRREQRSAETLLLRHELSAVEQSSLLANVQRSLSDVRTVLSEGRFTLIGQVPQEANVAGHIQKWIGELPEPLQVAHRPNAS